MRASFRPLMLLLETVILILTALEMFIMFSFMLMETQHQQSSAFYMAYSVFMLGVFGYLFLCAAFFDIWYVEGNGLATCSILPDAH